MRTVISILYPAIARLLSPRRACCVLLACFAWLSFATSASAAPGDVDPLNVDINGSVLASAVQPDGKIIIGGNFISVLGQPRNNIARLNADGTLDAGFNPNPNSTVLSVAVQADGRILLGGDFSSVGASVRNRIARVDAAGTLDAGFNPNASNTVYSLAIQADGGILLGGNFGLVGGIVRSGLARVDAAGALDAGFNPNADNAVRSVAVQADGKILLGGDFNNVGGTARNRIARVDAAGALDVSFNPNANNAVQSVAIQADGRILLGGAFSTVGGIVRSGIARVDAAGALDAGFNANTDSVVRSIAVQADGRILLGGFFSEVGGIVRNRIARVDASGALAVGFNPNASGVVYSVAVQADGRILLGGQFTSVGGTPRNNFARLLNDPATQTLSTPDATQITWTRGGSAPEVSLVSFELSTDSGVTWTALGSGTRIGSTPNWQLTGLSLPGTGQLRARGRTDRGGLVQSTASYIRPGAVDSLNANVVGGFVVGTAVQPDGKTIIAGNFTSVLGVPRSHIARLNADGTLDLGYNPNANNFVYSVTVQPDGKAILCGVFTALQPNGAATATARGRIARLNADGTLDLSFDPNANSIVNSVALQADGKVVLSGEFTALQPNGAVSATTRNRVARVNADGTLDLSFDPNANGTVRSVALQADGKVLLGGAFTMLQPGGAVSATARNRIARVHADGTLDTNFDPNANNIVWGIAVQADGRVLLGGTFTTLQPGGAASASARNGIARVNADGTLDTGFDPNANNSVFGLAVQADGKVLLSGAFTTLQPNGAVSATARGRIARLHTDGTLDLGFFDPNANNIVYSVALQADGKVLVGGEFSTLQPSGAAAAIARNFFASIVNDPATQSISISSASRVQWLRGGTAPEAAQVSFELSTDGGTTYSALGTGTRISGGWEGTCLALPVNGTVRARARTPAGFYGGSNGGLVEQVTSYLFLPPTLSSITPTSGGVLGSTSVTISGTNLTGATAVSFGGTSATTFSVINATTLTATAPAHAAGAVSVVVTAPGGSNTANALYTYVAPPSVSLATANLLTTATTLTITGTSFSTTPGDNSITFSPAGTGTVTAATATLLTISSLSGLTPGALNAVVATNGQSSGAAVQVATVIAPGSGGGQADALNAALLGSYVLATAVQPDGKTIIAGQFSSVLGQPRNNMARLNADGTLDAGFNPSVNSDVFSVAVQADGGILLGGYFTTVGGTARNRIARVNANGALDASFDPNADNGVTGIAVQADGSIVLGGVFNSVGGTARNFIARVDAAGALDLGFNPNANAQVNSLAVQADGGILLGGNFGMVGGIARNNIARVDAAGTLDASFNPNANNFVRSVAVQADGKILLGGNFSLMGGIGRNRIARVDAASVVDAGFFPNTNLLFTTVASLAVQADGAILLRGAFTSVGGVARNRIARVDAAGAVDLGFDPNANGNVFSVAVQADGKILLGGDFTSMFGIVRNRFARLLNVPATQTLSAPDATQVIWTRGGSAPEVSQVTLSEVMTAARPGSCSAVAPASAARPTGNAPASRSPAPACCARVAEPRTATKTAAPASSSTCSVLTSPLPCPTPRPSAPHAPVMARCKSISRHRPTMAVPQF
jgi:uncharacterized delta-60 repeat protein